MNEERKIFDLYLRDHHIFTLSVNVQGRPHTTPIFYVLDETDGTLIFMSDPNTVHGRAISDNTPCSGAVHDDVREVEKIRGMQFSGEIKSAGDSKRGSKYRLYLKNFPEAEKLSGNLYIFQIKWMKMTDNTVAFGFKREWGIDPFS